MESFDVVIAGAGPGGLSAAGAIARRGKSVLVLEQNHEIGSPVRTTGGSFVRDMEALGIPAHLYHKVGGCRFVSPNNAAAFRYADPVMCIVDVHGLLRYLAERAIEAGARISVATAASEPVLDNGFVTGLKAKGPTAGAYEVASRIVIDATGHRASLLRQSGVHPGFRRFGVGAEYDMYAPHYDQGEAVLVVGSEVAPYGYAWFAPWGNHRVRVGVGIIHPDTAEHPNRYLDALVANASRFGCDLRGAQPMEYHYGLIPSDGLADCFVGNGILAVGDAAGQPSALVGEGIRWAIKAGRMAGIAAVEALDRGDVSRSSLMPYQERWNAEFAVNLRIAYEINRKIAAFDDAAWDEKTELLKLFNPHQFDQALQSNFLSGWVLQLLWSHPKLMKHGLKQIAARIGMPS